MNVDISVVLVAGSWIASYMSALLQRIDELAVLVELVGAQLVELQAGLYVRLLIKCQSTVLSKMVYLPDETVHNLENTNLFIFGSIQY